MNAAALLLLAILPRFDVARDAVETIEVNHFYDEHGREVFCQVIFWDSQNVIAWRMNPNRKLDPVNCVTWFNDQGVIRCIRARTAIETWGQRDHETADREFLPLDKRRGLRRN